jgi:uncharacterized protein YjhX (UPF0386 family)
MFFMVCSKFTCVFAPSLGKFRARLTGRHAMPDRCVVNDQWQCIMQATCKNPADGFEFEEVAHNNFTKLGTEKNVAPGSGRRFRASKSRSTTQVPGTHM